MHGYDVLDHTRVSDELGGEAGLRRARRDRPPARPRPRRRRGAQPHGAGRAGEQQRPAVGRAARTAATPRTRTGSTSTGTPAAAGSACRCCGSRSPTCWPRATCASARSTTASRCSATTTTSSRSRDGTEGRRPGRRGAAVLAQQHYRLAGWRERDDGAQLPPVLRRRPADRGPRRAARRLRGHPPGAARPQPRAASSRASASTTPTGWPTPRATSRGCARRPAPGTAIWVEKILEGDERLPAAWACDGTTGYDAAQGGPDARWSTRPPRRPCTDAWARGRRRARPGARRSTRPSARWSPTSLGPEVARLIRRAREALPDAGPRAARARRSSSCSSPARSTAPTSAPASGSTPLAAHADRGRLRRPPARPAPTSRPSSSSWCDLATVEADDEAGRATSPSGCSRPGDR